MAAKYNDEFSAATLAGAFFTHERIFRGVKSQNCAAGFICSRRFIVNGISVPGFRALKRLVEVGDKINCVRTVRGADFVDVKPRHFFAADGHGTVGANEQRRR